jgi:hypothetical protein
VVITPNRTPLSPKTRTLVSIGAASANPPASPHCGLMSSLPSRPPSKLLPMKSSEMIRRNDASSPLASAARANSAADRCWVGADYVVQIGLLDL